MNQAWVGGGSPPPYSAVPLLPATYPGRPASAVAGAAGDDGAHQLAQRRALAVGELRAGALRVVREQPRRAPAARRRPSPATPAMISGLATIRSWPIIIAARATAVSPSGTLPSAAGQAELERRAEAEVARRVAAARRRPARSASETNAVLHDCAKSVAERHGAGGARPRSCWNERPSTTSVARARHGLVDVDSPSRSSAAVVITLNVEPGG